jgi:hypothetical protein
MGFVAVVHFAAAVSGVTAAFVAVAVGGSRSRRSLDAGDACGTATGGVLQRATAKSGSWCCCRLSCWY